jgi:protein CWC15
VDWYWHDVVVPENQKKSKRSRSPVFQVKRRWDDDVVFKNQARGEPKAQKRFINDTIRNDFHKRFLTRFMK